MTSITLPESSGTMSAESLTEAFEDGEVLSQMNKNNDRVLAIVDEMIEDGTVVIIGRVVTGLKHAKESGLI